MTYNVIRLDSKFIIVSVAAAPQIPPAQTQKAPAPPPPSGPRYVAVYDYTAADDDEISFQEGMSLPFIFSFSFPLFPAPIYTCTSLLSPFSSRSPPPNKAVTVAKIFHIYTSITVSMSIPSTLLYRL